MPRPQIKQIQVGQALNLKIFKGTTINFKKGLRKICSKELKGIMTTGRNLQQSTKERSSPVNTLEPKRILNCFLEN